MRARVLLSVGLALSCFSALAHADDPGSFDSLLRLGVTLRREHRNEEALDAFQRALAISPTPTARAQVGLAEQALGRWLEAEGDLAAALENTGDAWIAKNRPTLEDARAQIAMHLAWLTVAVDVAGSQVRIDGRSIAPNTEERVRSGPAAIAVSASGYVPDIRHIDILAAEHAHVEIAMVPLVARSPTSAAAPSPAAPEPLVSSAATGPSESSRSPAFPAAPAALGIVGFAGLGVGAYFGVQAFDQKRQRDAQCSAGACLPSAFAIDGDARASSLASTVAFGSGAAALAAAAAWWMLDPPRKGSSRGPRWVAPVILGALGVASLGTGAYLGLLAIRDKHSRDAECSGGGCSPAALSYDAEARTAASLSTVTFGAGAALVGSAATLWILEPRNTAHSGTGLAARPQVAIGPWGLILHGTFE